MRIVVNDIAASSGGALTVLKAFYNCVRENDRDNEWIFLLGDNLLEETDNIKIKVLKDVKASGAKKLLFDFFTGKKYIHALKPDVVLSLQNIITFGVKVPQLVYIHQSIPFQTVKNFSFLKASERKLAVYQHIIGAIIKLSAKKSDKVIVQTEWMRKAVCESCHLPPEKVVKAMPNVKGIEVRADDESFQADQFFYPTSSGIYKNNTAIIRASEQLIKEGLAHTVTLTLPEEKSQGNIRCIGRIPYSEVLEHYRSSSLLFPSYIETFGYPLAEARKVGTIILAAETPFARELLDGYENAYFFDPFRPDALATLMSKVIHGQIAMRKADTSRTDSQDNWLEVLSLIKSM